MITFDYAREIDQITELSVEVGKARRSLALYRWSTIFLLVVDCALLKALLAVRTFPEVEALLSQYPSLSGLLALAYGALLALLIIGILGGIVVAGYVLTTKSRIETIVR